MRMGRSWQSVVVIVAGVWAVLALWTTPGAIAAADGLIQRDTTLTRADTVKLVKDDLARRLKVAASQLELVGESDETWRDSTLGCSARKPLGEPVVTPGFAFTLSHRGRSYLYHTDRRGNIRRCDAAPKPTGPIGR